MCGGHRLSHHRLDTQKEVRESPLSTMCLGLSLSRLQETQSVRVALPHSRRHPGQLRSALPWYTGGCFSAPDGFGKELLLLTVLGSCKVKDASLRFTYDLPQGTATVLHPETSGPVAEPSSPGQTLILFPQPPGLCRGSSFRVPARPVH